MTNAQQAIRRFASDAAGSETVEYALVIALVVIGLVLALGSSTSPLSGTFASLYSRVAACLAATAFTC